MQIDHNLTWRETIWLVEIDFFLGIQKVHNNDTSEMRNIYWTSLSASEPYLWVGHHIAID